jgi:hypothetical protein
MVRDKTEENAQPRRGGRREASIVSPRDHAAGEAVEVLLATARSVTYVELSSARR